MTFDITKLAAKDTAEIHLKHPATDESLYADEAKEKPVKIIVWGTSSKAYRQAINAMQNRQLKRGKKQATAEVMREESIELLVACSQKAVNMAFEGQAIDTPEMFRKMYSNDAYSWVKEQIDQSLSDASLFTNA